MTDQKTAADGSVWVRATPELLALIKAAKASIGPIETGVTGRLIADAARAFAVASSRT